MSHYTRYQALQDQVGWTLGSLAVLVVAARIYCRCVAQRIFRLDDTFMVMALAAGIVMMALISAAVAHGYGLHVYEITDSSDREMALMLTFIAPSVSVIASTFGKISMVLFLIHLLGSRVKKIHLWLLYGVTAIMIAVNIFMIGVFLGQCTPMQKSWRPDIAGTCVSHAVWDFGGRFQAGWNAFMDLVTAGFSIYMVWSLQLKRSTKWGLSALMGGGLSAAAATFAKIWYMSGNMTNLTDVTYAWAPLSLCYIAEVFVLIIAGSLPTLRPILGYDNSRSSRGIFAAFRKDEESTSPSKYDGTTLAGTTGWELPAWIGCEEGQDGLTALPPCPSQPDSNNNRAPSPHTTHAHLRDSLGPITVYQDFSISYELTPRDSMSLESNERRQSAF